MSREARTGKLDELGSRDAGVLRKMHEARVVAELADADRLCPGSDAVSAVGSLFAQTALVKGRRGPAEESGGSAMSGEDGEALDRALEALGYDPTRSFRTLSRPEPGIDVDPCAQRLRLQLEAVDPEVIFALDPEAADDLARAFGLARLPMGVATKARGRLFVAVDGFEASLHDPARKRRVWTQLKAGRRESPKA